MRRVAAILECQANVYMPVHLCVCEWIRGRREGRYDGYRDIPHLKLLLMFVVLLVYLYPDIPLDIVDNFSDIISSLNVFSLVFCVFLVIKGLNTSDYEESL